MTEIPSKPKKEVKSLDEIYRGSIGQFQCLAKFLLKYEKQNPSHSSIEHIKNSKTTKFGREMLKNAENIALQNLPLLYTFLLQAEIRTTFRVKVVMDFVFHVLIKI